MAEFQDLKGQTFGYWKVLARAVNYKDGSAQWICQCECGTQQILRASSLKSGNSRSCGCHKNDYNRKHGGKGTRLYEIWRAMRYRCQNPEHQAYKDYGGRGIKACSEWEDFGVFREWAVTAGYDDTKSIDRIDVDGDYAPGNCRWTDCETQMNNRRNTPHYTLWGETLTISQWSKRLGIPRSTIYNRMKQGLSFEQAVQK